MVSCPHCKCYTRFALLRFAPCTVTATARQYDPWKIPGNPWKNSEKLGNTEPNGEKTRGPVKKKWFSVATV
jgi:hypothetical protein